MEAFNVIGISVRTTNENEQMAKDIGALWERFHSEGIADQISHKVDDAVYAVYSDYEKDYTKPYTITVGCKVKDLSEIPEGMSGVVVQKGNYQKHTAKGDIFAGSVYHTWQKIWAEEKDSRAYATDYEVYDERAANPHDAEVDIFIGV